MKVVRVGDEAPEAFILELANDEGVSPALDFNTVTAAEFRVRLPDGTKATWTAAMSLQATDFIRLTHVYAAGGGDLPMQGEYRVRAWLTTPDGPRKSEPVVLPVRGEFEA